MSVNIENLKNDWNNIKDSSEIISSNALSSLIEFCEIFPKEQLANMKLDSYTNLVKDEDNYFTNWVERKTKIIATMGPTYSKYGIKKNAENNVYKDTVDNKDVSAEKAESIYKENILPQIIKIANLDDVGELKMTVQFARKIAYLYNPEKLLPILSNSTLEKIAKAFDITIDLKSYKVTEEILNKIKEIFEIKELNFNITFTLGWLLWTHFGNDIDDLMSKYISETSKGKNIIFTGIPGTGKTYSIMEFLKQNNSYEYEFVQFHPSYDYEDFIEGLKPIPSSNGQIEFKLVNGVFKRLCQRAFKDKDKTFVMVIDEINRANLSRVFGELLYCLEYRNEFVSTKMTTYIQSLDELKDKKDFSVSEDEKNIGKFAIPDNIIILGTMNEVDRSIDAFDLALRRRFIWEDVGFNETALRLYTPFFTNGFQTHIEDLIVKANRLNNKLDDEIGKNYTLGHTYYFKIIDYFNGDFNSALCDLWDYHIKSIAREYCKIKFGENELNNKLEEYRKIVVGDNNNCNG